MGFRISWIGFKGTDRAAYLAALRMEEKGNDDDALDYPFSAATLPTGWTILFSNNFGFVTDALLGELSTRWPVIGCKVNETVMYSSASAFADGQQQWLVSYDSQMPYPGMAQSGSPPAELAEIRDRLLAEQEREGGNDAEVAHQFDIAVELAAAITGFRHDYDPAAPFTEVGPPTRPSFLKRLFGLG